MISSLGFGFNSYNLSTAINGCFCYAYIFKIKLAIKIKLLIHYAKGTQVLKFFKKLKTYSTLWQRVSHAFHSLNKGFFSHFPHGTFTLSVIVYILRLDGGPPIFEQSYELCSTFF